MAAPIKNDFWKQRTKHGRDKIFSSPELLWEEACKFFEWSTDNPLQEKDWVGKNGKEVIKDRPRPFTLSALCLFLNISVLTFDTYSKREDFKEVCDRIRQTCFVQKFNAAAVGFLNANLISKELGLIDKTKLDIDFNKMSEQELDTIIKKLIEAHENNL